MAGKRANGEGSVGRLADGRWQGRYTVRDGDGQPIRRAFYGRTRAEVQAKLESALRDRHLGLISARRGRGPTVASYAERWLTVHEVRLRESTAIRYRELITRHVVPRIGNVLLTRLESAHVNDLVAAKLREGLAPRTVHHIRAVLRTMLNAALREGYVQRNAAALADPPAVPHVERATVTAELARDLLTLAVEDRDGPLWTLALSTGARLGELLALRWSDFDAAAGTLRISRSARRIRGEIVVTDTKTPRSRRVLALPPLAAEALARQRRQQAADRLQAGAAWADREGFIFTRPDGRLRDPTSVTPRLRAACRRAGLPALGFHDLRHGLASLLSSQGVAPTDVQAQLGHSTVLTTLGIYTHQLPSSARHVAEVVQAMLTAPTG
ncbi:MAG: site-specific integrase [Candidatus Dormibacteraeota bacterium]|jgi:integrase|nr:site-specific integrase [Candidatus Dormibacteraeota bacterium]